MSIGQLRRLPTLIRNYYNPQQHRGFRALDAFLSPKASPPVLSASRTPGTALTMEMLSESWIRNARHSRLALDERGSCLRTSICATGTSRGSRGLISPSFPSCILQMEPLSLSTLPRLVAQILYARV